MQPMRTETPAKKKNGRGSRHQEQRPGAYISTNMESAMKKRSHTTIEGPSARDLCLVERPATESAACSSSSGQGEHFLRSLALLWYNLVAESPPLNSGAPCLWGQSRALMYPQCVLMHGNTEARASRSPLLYYCHTL